MVTNNNKCRQTQQIVGSDGPTGFTYTATSSATYYLTTGGNGVGVLGTYKVSATELGAVPDDYAASTATTGVVAVNGSTIGTIETSNDVDWFAVALTAGETYRFKSEGASTGQGTIQSLYIELHDNAGVGLIGSDGPTGFTYTATSSATYYLATGGNGVGVLGTYKVSATDLGAVPDDYAASTATTGVVAVNGWTIGTIETSNDVDWFAVALTAGETCRFKSEGASTGQGIIQSLYIELHDNAGVGLIGSDGPTGFTYTATSSATYYLATGGNGVGDLGTYKVSATDLGAVPDDYAASTATTGVVAVNGCAPRRRESSVEEDSTRELSIDLEADEQLSRVTGGLEPRDKGDLGWLSDPAGRNACEA